MTDWPDLPMTLSSALEGFRLEMYSRLDQRITINDILDRMPSNPDGSRAVVSDPTPVPRASGTDIIRSPPLSATGDAAFESVTALSLGTTATVLLCSSIRSRQGLRQNSLLGIALRLVSHAISLICAY